MAVTKSEGDGNHPSSHYLIVEDPEHPSSWHLRVKGPDGKPDHGLMGAAWAALHTGYRGNTYQGPGKTEAIAKLKALYKSEKMDTPDQQKSSEVANIFSRDLRLALGEAVTREINGQSRQLHEMPVCVTGDWVKGGRKFSITSQELQQMAANFRKRQNGSIVVDYEHASEDPSVARGGPVPAAGWIHELSANGMLKALVEWTPQALEMIRSGQYRFFSPAIDFGAKDKESGESQGATMTSGALTNHPFLEELPAITLSDLERETESARGGRKEAFSMAAKNLSMKCSADGKHQVFDGDEMLGEVPEGHLKTYAKTHLGMGDTAPGNGEGGDNPKVKSSDVAVFTELGVAFGKDGATGLDDLRALVVRGRAALASDRTESARRLVLSSAVKDGVMDHGRCQVLATEGKITLADFISLQNADRIVSETFREGKILPLERGMHFQEALRDPAAYAEFAKKLPVRANLSSQGNPGAGPLPVDQEVHQGVQKLMADRKLGYGKAMKALFSENPDLEKRYQAEHRREIGRAASAE
ncbi:MAG TPA: phage protease [Terriglobia bacterium]|nr:phage protease [Terriglobia bacterium]